MGERTISKCKNSKVIRMVGEVREKKVQNYI